ncbi:MAG: DUF899 domain-containing protein, partial [Candidatus Zixiibacteriota bacterium]
MKSAQSQKKNRPLNKIVSEKTWSKSNDRFLEKEKKLTRLHDKLNAERRKLSMVKIEKGYVFKGPNGKVKLLDLFESRRQLILYHFMFDPDWKEGCPGCSMFTDNVGHLAHIRARNTSFVLVSLAPLSKIISYQKRMGWDIPWYSSYGSDFNRDFGVTTNKGEHHGLSVFLRDGDNIYRTYYTTDRGVEALGSNWTFLDLTPFGRQENWEKSPKGIPQSEPY